MLNTGTERVTSTGFVPFCFSRLGFIILFQVITVLICQVVELDSFKEVR